MRLRLPSLYNETRSFYKKICRALLAIAFASLLSATALSQEATQTAPWAYKLQFENKWVRVIRVHYEPHEKIPVHAHPIWPCIYVYLNDSGPVIFRHKEWDLEDLTRPPTKAGSFRVSPTSAVNEVHEVENPSDLPSDFLRVEFKTEPVGRTSLRGRFYREEIRANENFQRVQFENAQLRVTRLVCAPQKHLEVRASPSEPSLLISLPAVDQQPKGADEQPMPGQTIWIDGGEQKRFENSGAAPLEWLRFDFKTAPMKTPEKRK